MSLNRLVSEHEVPAALRRPLVFGDREQINAIYDMEARIENLEAETAALEKGELREFRVTVEYIGETHHVIMAASEEEASEKALEESNIDNSGLEVSAFAVEARKGHV
jgi:hypothetical protein